tara:strand:+ start:2122 stop:3306 length:1185 start_codon:yes stop_codon:yes gene_type:complete
MQSFVTFYENFYKQGDEYVYREPVEGEADNLEMVVEEVNKFVPITGSNSRAINKRITNLSQAFVGYDVYSEKDDGMRDKIYAAVKGTANLLGEEEYHRVFTAMAPAHYSSLLDRSVNAFVGAVKESYDFILYPQSASRNVEDIAERLEAGLGRRFPDTEIVVGQIDKKLIDPNTIGAVLDVEDLLERAHKALMKAAEIGYGDGGIPEGFAAEATTTLEEFIVDRLETWASNEDRYHVPYSNARHLRPWVLQGFFGPLITRIKNEEAGDSFLPLQKQAEGRMGSETGRMRSDIRINGHMNDFSTSVLTFDSLIASFQQFVKDRGNDALGNPSKPRFLIVDDNINTGDIFKQLTPIYDLHDEHFDDSRAARGWGAERIYMDFFFLMKDVKALTKDT